MEKLKKKPTPLLAVLNRHRNRLDVMGKQDGLLGPKRVTMQTWIGVKNNKEEMVSSAIEWTHLYLYLLKVCVSLCV